MRSLVGKFLVWQSRGHWFESNPPSTLTHYNLIHFYYHAYFLKLVYRKEKFYFLLRSGDNFFLILIKIKLLHYFSSFSMNEFFFLLQNTYYQPGFLRMRLKTHKNSTFPIPRASQGSESITKRTESIKYLIPGNQ